jgi:hypothetical protein
MSSRSNQRIYLLCAVGFAAGILLLVLLDGAALTLAALPLGLSIGIALRTWWKKHGWNPGITITEDLPEGQEAAERSSIETPSHSFKNSGPYGRQVISALRLGPESS